MSKKGLTRQELAAMLHALRFCFGDANAMDAEMVFEAYHNRLNRLLTKVVSNKDNDHIIPRF